MAEIKIERRSRKPIWPWAAGIVLLLLLIWGLVEFFEASEPVEQDLAVTEVETTRLADEPAYEAGGRIEEFVNFVQQDEAAPEMGPEHEYTSEGIQRLSAALSALAQQEAPDDVEISQRRARLEQTAEQIQQDPESLEHANAIKEAFMQAADLMEAIQEESFPERESVVETVREAAQNIEAAEPTLEQQEQIKNFFSQAAEALQVMEVGS